MGKANQPAAVVFDLEFTAWQGSLENRWLQPGQFKEIVQIGAVKVDAGFVPLERFDMLVRPRINAQLSRYLEDLIATSNAELMAHGVDFLEAYQAFVEFCGGLPLCAYGRDDLVIADNMRLYGIKDAPALPSYINVRPWLSANGIDVRKARACEVGPAAGVPFEGHQHNGLDDALSVAAGIRALIERGATSPLVTPVCDPPPNDESVAGRIAAALDLHPHPEGGYYREIFRDRDGQNGRGHSTAIYYLLRAGEESQSHRIDAAEVWHFYKGAPLELIIREPGKLPSRHVLGADVEHGEQPQIVVPAHAWQSAKPLGEYTLVGCTVAPAFLFEKFEMEEQP